MSHSDWADDLRDDEDPDFDDEFEDEEDETIDLISCPVCDGEIYGDVEQCPLCGNYITANTSLRPLWWWTSALVLGALLLGFTTCQLAVP